MLIFFELLTLSISKLFKTCLLTILVWGGFDFLLGFEFYVYYWSNEFSILKAWIFYVYYWFLDYNLLIDEMIFKFILLALGFLT